MISFFLRNSDPLLSSVIIISQKVRDADVFHIHIRPVGSSLLRRYGVLSLLLLSSHAHNSTLRRHLSLISPRHGAERRLSLSLGNHGTPCVISLGRPLGCGRCLGLGFLTVKGIKP